MSFSLSVFLCSLSASLADCLREDMAREQKGPGKEEEGNVPLVIVSSACLQSSRLSAVSNERLVLRSRKLFHYEGLYASLTCVPYAGTHGGSPACPDLHTYVGQG